MIAIDSEPIFVESNGCRGSIEQSVATSDYCSLFASLLRLPSRACLDSLVNGSLADVIESLSADVGFPASADREVERALDLLRSYVGKDDVSLSDIRSDYTYLFDHPVLPAVQRYEGLFRYFEQHPDRQTYEGAPIRFVNPAALDAERCFKKAGFVRSENLNEPADSISTEFEFLCNLYRGKAEALETNEIRQVSFADECIEEFSRIHLRKWFVPFFEACARESRITFYRAIGLLGAVFSTHILNEQQG